MTMQVWVPHTHLLDDLRGPLLPVDGLSHISRINGWLGSDAWVEGCRADKWFEEFPMQSNYPEPKLPYKLLQPAYHEGSRRRVGEVVMIEPSKRGYQHAKIPGQTYPDIPDPPAPGTLEAPKLADDIAELARRVAALEERVNDLIPTPGRIYADAEQKGTPVTFTPPSPEAEKKP